MSIINFDDYIDDKQQYRNTNGIMKHPFRAIVCGATGYGKTNSVCNLLLNPAFKLDYDHIYLYARDLSEEKYVLLIKYFTDIEAKILQKTNEVIKLITYSNKLEDLAKLETIDKTKQNIVIFDDWSNEKTANLEEVKNYYTMGRKFNVSCFYICHSWYAIPKMIRLNTQYVLGYRLPSARELRELQKELATNIDKDDFIRAYKEATKNGYEFILIDKRSNDPKEQYRREFNKPIDWLVKKIENPHDEEKPEKETKKKTVRKTPNKKQKDESKDK